MKFLITLIHSLLAIAASAKESVTLSPERTIVLGGVITDGIVGPMTEAMVSLSKTGKEIDIIISSPGGSVIAGNTLVDRMVQLKGSGVKFRCFIS